MIKHKVKIDRRAPQSPWARQHLDAVMTVLELDVKIRELREQRKIAMEGLPNGIYHLVEANERVQIADKMATSVSIKLLSRYVTKDIIDRCRTRRVSRCITTQPLRKEQAQ